MKKCIVMRAIPGAGKTTLAAEFVMQGFKPCSADFHFMKDGVYNFDYHELGNAHKSCMRMFLDYVKAGENIIVDNTNLGLDELAPYIAVAEAFDYDVEVLQINCDPEVAFNRNIHSVSLSSVKRMHERMNSVSLPSRWKVTHRQAAE